MISNELMFLFFCIFLFLIVVLCGHYIKYKENEEEQRYHFEALNDYNEMNNSKYENTREENNMYSSMETSDLYA